MSELLNFKYGGSEKFDSVETKDQGTIYAVNDAYDETPGSAEVGSIYRGDKILGTTAASKLRTVKDIQVTEGSPINAMGLFEGNVIPAGTTVQELFEKLVSKEIYPTPTISKAGSFSVTLGKPSISASVSNNAIVEAGSTVTFSSIKSGADSISKTDAEVSGFTYGYKESTTGDKINQNKITSAWSYPTDGEGTYDLSLSVTKFSEPSVKSASASTDSECKISDLVLTVAKGTNTLTVTNTGKSYQATRPAVASMYVISNAGNVTEGKKSPELKGSSSSYKDNDGNSNTFSVEGIYPAYYGAVSSVNPTESELTNLTKVVAKKKALSVAGPFENEYMCVACPPGWTVAKAVDSNGFDNTSAMVSKTVNIVCLDGTTQTYNVYLIGPATQGDAFTMTFN